jgi:hypothetical protein
MDLAACGMLIGEVYYMTTWCVAVSCLSHEFVIQQLA